MKIAFKSHTLSIFSQLPQYISGDGISSACKQNNTEKRVNTPSANQDQTEASKRRDNIYFTRGYATSANLHTRSLSVDSVIEETVETKWIATPFLKVL